ncbi:hypothetical protein NDU88_000528 [Pleurodeles waltl]|uniref:Uncharacterized protein n=1 Tax=Pleurodeles waltl TaxID=8319 RepID=A0AAV7P1A7_PLEWA|nr:hypothetical protein NDU88_000528 [Pleurodeles waltl]
MAQSGISSQLPSYCSLHICPPPITRVRATEEVRHDTRTLEKARTGPDKERSLAEYSFPTRYHFLRRGGGHWGM